ncbi:MAG: hypothetical protein PHC33_04495 [Candidatus Omnitrophica bacterium]|nr:hypothetical protein [Candidatus Omnitrophota bacterium]
MEERNKNIIVVVLAVACVFLFVMFLNTFIGARKQKSDFFEEKALRWDLEQKAKELTNGRKSIEDKLDAALKSLETEKALHVSAEKTAVELRTANEKLTEELKKISREKELLEKRLKESAPQASADKPGSRR